MKIYGFEKTRLHLSETAAAAYDGTDPLRIIEQDNGLYSVRGVLDRDDMTEADVNAFLEELADDSAAALIDDDGLYRVPEEWFFDAISADGPVLTGGEVKALVKEWRTSLFDVLSMIEFIGWK